MAPDLKPTLLRWRARLLPDALGHGWVPFYLLGYLAFLFLPLVLVWFGESKRWTGPQEHLLVSTLLSVAVFLPLYFGAYRSTGLKQFACMVGIAALGYALMPFNAFANTYHIYAIGFAAMLCLPVWHRIGWAATLLMPLLPQVLWLHYPLFVFFVTAIVAVAVFFGNYHQRENQRKRAELLLTHDEIRRLAALAERERIGRDLHDLLGHTLSLVALKSELAGKLVARDANAAQREISEVARVAREALAQVRRAVSGIRAAGIAAELASARLLLESDGVAFTYALAEAALPPGVETALALTVREAVTNIQRHARALNAEVAFGTEGREAVLRIADDGRGGAIVPGNGLHGMRERIEALGGQLRIDSGPRRGTRIEARLPLAANDDAREA